MRGVGETFAAVGAEEIRSGIAALCVQHEGREPGPITVSVGLACASADTDGQSMLQTTDAALHRANKAATR